MKSLVLAFLLLAPQQVTAPEYVVVFEIKQEKPLADPVARINVVVRATSEGDAAVQAYRYLSTFVREERLSFLEAALRKP